MTDLETHLSHIDDEPTAGSDNLVKSGGVAATYGSYVENPEFIYVKTDSEGKILWAIKTDGTIYYGAGVPQQVIDYINEKIAELSLDEYEDIVTFLGSLIENDDTLSELLSEKVDKVTGKSLIDEEYSSSVKSVKNLDCTEIKTDADNKIISYRDNDGKLHENVGIETKELTANSANITNLNIDSIPSIILDYINSRTKNQDVTDAGSLLLRNHIKSNWSYYFSQYYPSETGSAPVSYDEEAYLDRKIREVPEGKSFIFVTDTHWVGNKKKSNYIIDYVRKRLNISKVVFGGDAIQSGNDKYTATQELTLYSEEFFSAFGQNSIWCQGNHDGNYVSWLNHKSDDGANINDWIISDVEGYKRTTKYIEDNVVFDSVSVNAINALQDYSADEKAEIIAWIKMHHYIDDVENKVRYIVYETGNGGYTEAIICHTSYQNVDILQWNWLATTLRSTPLDYDIVILGHMFGNAALELETRKIISAFKGRKKANMDNSKYSSNTLVGQPIFDALYGTARWNEYDFSDCPARTGKIFIVNGHFHIDAALEYHGNYTNKYDTTTVIRQWNNEDAHADDAVLNIWVDRDVYGNPGTPEFGGYANTKTADSVTEQTFDVITIASDGIYCTRFGAGNNRYFNY